MIFFSSVRSLDETLASSLGQGLLFQLRRQRGGMRSIRRYLVNTSHTLGDNLRKDHGFSSCVRILSLKSTKKPPRDWVPIFSLKTKSERIFNWNRAKAKILFHWTVLIYNIVFKGAFEEKKDQIRPKLPNPTLGYIAINSQSLLNARSLFQCSFPCIRTHKFKFIQILPFTSYLSCLFEKHLAVL